jgi:hypothetical protein
MPEGGPIRRPRRKDEHGSASRQRDVPVAGLLRDSIVGITCFPDPLPRSGKRRSRRWWRRHAKRREEPHLRDWRD